MTYIESNLIAQCLVISTDSDIAAPISSIAQNQMEK